LLQLQVRDFHAHFFLSLSPQTKHKKHFQNLSMFLEHALFFVKIFKKTSVYFWRPRKPQKIMLTVRHFRLIFSQSFTAILEGAPPKTSARQGPAAFRASASDSRRGPELRRRRTTRATTPVQQEKAQRSRIPTSGQQI
jgi:hypothetical protein